MFSINKVVRQNIFKKNGLALVLTVFLTVIASELKVVPFNGEAFRFGLGSIAFFLLILTFPPASLLLTGCITGIAVVSVRIAGDLLFHLDPFWTSVTNHVPAFLFYFLFALGFSIVKIERYKTLPFVLGAWAIGFEFIANSVEHFIRYWFLNHEIIGLRDWALLIGVAIFRSYFVVGLYSSITITEQKKRVEEMLGVGAELYSETLYLQKSMNHIEQITASSHDLYRQLKKNELHLLSVQALHIAQEIHEVKKDSQRILAGLQKITEIKKETPLLLSDVLQLVIHANEKYSELLKKDISFQLSISVDFETDQQIPLLALLNNITANAVEAIIQKGKIEVDVYEESLNTLFIIKDSGIGIKKEDISIVFEPGYTTKFNEKGVAATGIGLSHVKEIIHTLAGKIEIEPCKQGTVFRIHIPTNHIRK
ncbi:sensor histidine kinase [Psychrobacillus sp. FSL H8-0483]|uniref:sensor histidine kinase n=1 Tax=Psychrobacillus sp. FSL H8-0483 TaxID=2921389 RepID=UPI00315AF33D